MVQTKVAKKGKKFYGAKKKRIWDVDIDNIVISKLIKIKNDSKYLTKFLHEVIKPLRYLHQVIKLLILILPKIRGYVERIINWCLPT